MAYGVKIEVSLVYRKQDTFLFFGFVLRTGLRVNFFNLGSNFLPLTLFTLRFLDGSYMVDELENCVVLDSLTNSFFNYFFWNS